MRMLSQLIHTSQSQATINIARKSFAFLRRAAKQRLARSSCCLDNERMALPIREKTPVPITLPSLYNPTYTKQRWQRGQLSKDDWSW